MRRERKRYGMRKYEIGKYGEVFIGGNDNISYKKHKCGQKKFINCVKKSVESRLKNIPPFKKRVFLSLTNRPTYVN